MLTWVKVWRYRRRLLAAGHSSSKADRVAAAEALGELGDVRAVEPLISALGDLDQHVGSAAAGALGKLGDSRAVEPLIKVLGYEYAYAQERACEALVKLGGPGTTEQIIFATDSALGLGDDIHLRLGWEAAEALGKLGNARAVEVILQQAPGDRLVGWAAAEALGELGDARAVEPLTEALRAECRTLRRKAAKALAKLADARAVEPLIRALDDTDEDVRACAAAALAELGDIRAVEPLIMALAHAERVRTAAASALEHLGEPKWKTLVIGGNEDWERLACSGDPRAVAALVVYLRHAPVNVRDELVTALRKIDDPQVKAAVEKAGRTLYLERSPHSLAAKATFEHIKLHHRDSSFCLADLPLGLFRESAMDSLAGLRELQAQRSPQAMPMTLTDRFIVDEGEFVLRTLAHDELIASVASAGQYALTEKGRCMDIELRG